jgi:hypothetical protein
MTITKLLGFNILQMVFNKPSVNNVITDTFKKKKKKKKHQEIFYSRRFFKPSAKTVFLVVRRLFILKEINIPIFCNYKNDSYTMVLFDIKSRG